MATFDLVLMECDVDEQMGQLYELMVAIRKRRESGEDVD
jgi:hypothetical protein